jgi:hypothetical protein
VGIQLTAFSGHRPRYVGRRAMLISLALQQTVATKKATCPSAIDDHPKSEGPIFVSMTASEMFIDGQFPTVRSVEPVKDAVTEQVLGEGPGASRGDIDEAVGASRRALPDWSATPAAVRHLPERFADALAARVEDISQLRSRETGTPMSYGPAPHTAHNLARGWFVGRPTLDYSEGALRTGFQQSVSFLRILSGLRT